ncbi:MAG: glycosyltransferase [Candidatus Hydrogenedentes bacterium]|nr:glycosyltransferase [Candidatus Hydrogenedentota bacterium]
MTNGQQNGEPDVTIVVIGYNEAATLRACLESAHAADLDGIPHELIYVDGGSTDDSMRIAHTAGTDKILGGDRRRRAAENRNLGLRAARGQYVQFVDGDMAMDPGWPRAALAFLREHDEYAAVCGNLREANQSPLFRALQLEWAPREGVIRHCGGAAMYRRDVLNEIGGFPEDVVYGEEPYLCWRIRNELGKKIYQINRLMADHDLGFAGWRDFWKRQVRCGATYAEIAVRCYHSNDRLWFKEAIMNAAWFGAILVALAVLITGPVPARWFVLIAALALFQRKFSQTIRAGHPADVAAIYALQTYYAKIPIAIGEIKWLISRLSKPSRKSS